jgi:hypothetical protein
MVGVGQFNLKLPDNRIEGCGIPRTITTAIIGAGMLRPANPCRSMFTAAEESAVRCDHPKATDRAQKKGPPREQA